jgi:ABC-type lipoprotein export system ATPase subunit/GNAT superfamily N-acetyltransferase
MKIKLQTNIVNDEYTQYVYDTFDIKDKSKTEVIVEYNLTTLNTFDWNIGVIIGGSGSGKTTILKQLGELIEPTFDNEKALISNFDFLTPQEATRLLSSMGLSSVPTWLRPYDKLSNGEQYRARLSYLVAKSEDVVLIDEYTSVVDRDVAKAMSFALQKYIRKTNKKIIVASCHYDILEWLMPDWTCSPQKRGVVERHDYLRQGRPKIELQVSRVESKTWKFFKKHHYLTEQVSESCKFLLFEWNSKPVAINAILPQPSGHFDNGVRESRIVVLPDFQGLGLGYKISEFTASIYKSIGYRYFTKTVHPALGIYRNKNNSIWIGTSKNGKKPEAQNTMGKMNNWNVLTRTSFCHEYIGEPIFGYEELLQDIYRMRDRKQYKLF